VSRTRPRNRRALIVAAATDLFARRGYDEISMSDIAEAVEIGPSALYRHFAGKQDLLREVLTSGLLPVRELFGRRDLSVAQVATIALDQRQLGVLWQREARHMRPDDYLALRAELRSIGQLLADRVLFARPELSAAAANLLAWAVIAVVSSTSFHHLELPRPQYELLIAELLDAVLAAEVPAGFGAARDFPSHGLVPNSRREALLAQAVRMFAQQGYTGVGIEDIGAAVGIAGPSIYNHFPSKRDMLTLALQRGTAVLFMDLTTIYSTAADARDALNRLVRSYVGFALRHHDVIDLMITELGHLGEDEQHRARQAQYEYISEWTHLLQIVHSGLDATAARVRVQAVLSIVNNAVRTVRFRRDSGVAEVLEVMCGRLLL
jgi:AcrR family transcriptional regulator